MSARQPTWRGHYGAFLGPTYREPVTMHLFDGVFASKQRPGDNADYTLCGREMSRHAIYLPLRHAEKFALPCRVCDRIAARKEAVAA